MSRGRKKHPCSSDNGMAYCRKTYANRKVRRQPDLPTSKGNHYKKVYESWDICEFKDMIDKSDYLEMMLEQGYTKEEAEERYRRFYVRK